jgi:hypothetical protein
MHAQGYQKVAITGKCALARGWVSEGLVLERIAIKLAVRDQSEHDAISSNWQRK